MNPWLKNPQAALHPGPYEEGDRVRFHWRGPVEGVIVEDRGNIGVKGRRMYRVVADLDGGISDPLDIELPAEDLTLVARGEGKSDNGRQG
jgi:hypothetical protein